MQYIINKNLEVISEKQAAEEKIYYRINCGKSGVLKIERTRQGRDPQVVLKEKAELKTKKLVAALAEGFAENKVKDPEEKAEALRELIKWSRDAILDGVTRKPKANYWLGEDEDDAAERKAEERKSRKAEQEDDDDAEEKPSKSSKKDRDTVKNAIKKFTEKKKDLDDEEEEEEKPRGKKVRGGKKNSDPEIDVTELDDEYLDDDSDDGDDEEEEEKPRGKKVRGGKKSQKDADDDDGDDYDSDDGDDDGEDEEEEEKPRGKKNDKKSGKEITATFVFEKKTKNYSKYVPEDSEDSEVLGTLYLDPSIKAEEITVTVKIA